MNPASIGDLAAVDVEEVTRWRRQDGKRPWGMCGASEIVLTSWESPSLGSSPSIWIDPVE
jgi:hypothetical protein